MNNECGRGCNIKTYLGWCDQYNEDSTCPCSICLVKAMCHLECMKWLTWATTVEGRSDYIGDKKMESNCANCSNYDDKCNLEYHEAYGGCIFKTLNSRTMK